MALIRTEKLKKYYQTEGNIVKALDDVTLDVERGEFVAVVGESGSGKSTLLHMLGGLDYVTQGKVFIGNEEINGLSEDDLCIFRRRYVGFIFQNYNLIPILTVYENIILPLKLDGKRVDEAYVDDLIKTLGIGDKLHARPNELSGGQQQRVAIARALATKPRIVLADEPTGNLDSKNSIEVIGLLKVTSKKFNQTTVMITHNQHLALMADRIIHLRDGHILEADYD